MDFNDTPQEAEFRKKVRSWLDANAPKHLEAELKRASFGSNGLESEDPIKASKAWQKKKAEAGWACLHWPKEYGGGARSAMERVIWSQEEGPYAVLSGLFTIGHGMCGPTVMSGPMKSGRNACYHRSQAARKSGASSSLSLPAALTLQACAPRR